VDQTFGRYLINGTEAGGVAGSCGKGFTPGAGFGPWLYYQDPGYCQSGAPTIPYSTAASNPNLALTVNNFGAAISSSRIPRPAASPTRRRIGESVVGCRVVNNTEQFFKII